MTDNYKEKYHELLKDMWNHFGVISSEMSRLDHMGSRTDSISIEARGVIHKIIDEEKLGMNYLTNDREEWELTIKKWQKLWEKRHG